MGTLPVTSRPVTSFPVTSQKQIRTRKKRTKSKTYTHRPYVDDILFGPPIESPSFLAPWEKPRDRRRPVYTFDCTDYKQKLSTEAKKRPLSGNPNTCSPSTRVQLKNAENLASRTKAKSNTAHKGSFVDEGLFGPRLEESSWRAPWEEKPSKSKPLLFDAFDYKMNVKQDLAVTSERRGGDSLKRSNSVGILAPRPAWR